MASSVGLLLTTLEEIKIKHAIRLGFRVTHNEAEYEALIACLNVTKDAGASQITVYTDSKLVKGQVMGEYEAKEDWIQGYLARVRDLMS